MKYNLEGKIFKSVSNTKNDEITELTLEKHEGAYEKWPSKSKLFRNKTYVGKKIPGYYIERQYQLDDGHYFLVTSYDCPFEEQCDLLLLDNRFNLVAKRSLIPWFYSSWNFDDDQYLGNNKFVLTFNTDYRLEITLDPNKFLGWRKIAYKRLKKHITW